MDDIFSDITNDYDKLWSTEYINDIIYNNDWDNLWSTANDSSSPEPIKKRKGAQPRPQSYKKVQSDNKFKIRQLCLDDMCLMCNITANLLNVPGFKLPIYSSTENIIEQKLPLAFLNILRIMVYVIIFKILID